MPTDKETVRIAATADIHCTRNSQGEFQPLFTEISQKADVLLICGDLTDYGHPEEAQVLVKELSAARVPIVAVLGNHDYESGQHRLVFDILCEAGVIMLDGDTQEVCGVGFAGTKGFAGGFGRGALAPWGESAIKAFVQEAVDEAMKLEKAVARLRTPRKIAVLHYAPIQATVEGEPPEIFPFLGSSRLEEPLLRYPVSAVFHGHAHHGTFEGRTRDNVPVYNVGVPVLRRRFPDKSPYFLLELPVGETES